MEDKVSGALASTARPQELAVMNDHIQRGNARTLEEHDSSAINKAKTIRPC